MVLPTCIMKIPPLHSTVRVNTMKLDIEMAKKRMSEMLEKSYAGRAHDIPTVEVHEKITDLLIIKGHGPFETKVRPSLEIYVDKKCGKSVLRGADIYASGILGSSRPFAVKENASVYMDLSGDVRLGWKKPYNGKKVFLGIGQCTVSRYDLFRTALPQPRGTVGVDMKLCVWNQPVLPSPIEDWGFPQNLPSVLCSHVLDPQPYESVIDLCAAPGGKSTHIARLMNDQGLLVCVDHSASRIAQLNRNISLFSLACVKTICMDATKLKGSRPSFFPTEGFDRVLLDAPCSATGQRPLFTVPNEKDMTSFPLLQKRLMHSAVKLTKSGGYLVYSTCTLNVEENEAIVAWALDQYSNLKLVPQHPHIGTGEPVNIGGHNMDLVQKFDPTARCLRHKNVPPCLEDVQLETIETWQKPFKNLTVDEDTIGFFIAKFQKT